MSEQIELAKAIGLGADMERFLESSVGQFILKRCEEEREAAVAAFRGANPMDQMAMAKIHQRLVVVDLLQTWMADAIQEAANAAQEIEAMSFTD